VEIMAMLITVTVLFMGAMGLIIYLASEVNSLRSENKILWGDNKFWLGEYRRLQKRVDSDVKYWRDEYERALPFLHNKLD